jgi:DNA processing protein
VAAAFKDLRHRPGARDSWLELLWCAAGRSDPLTPASIRQLLDRADEAIARAQREKIEAIPLGDARYPPLLACVADPPPVLWVKGCVGALSRPCIAVVGSRAGTSYAREVAARLGRELAERGVVVASGLARGVDSAAHRGCLQAGGETVAVLGCGVDRVYPCEHEELAAEVAASGALLGELAAGAPPLPEHFPLRNRIISGLSLATVVVEASENSGSLITARFALQQGRDVMAVPGSVLSGRNRGSHALLKDGARVVECADDILSDVGWGVPLAAPVPAKSPIAEPFLQLMDPGELYELDQLVSLSGMDGSRLLARLTELELAGMITASGGRFARSAADSTRDGRRNDRRERTHGTEP